MSVGNKIGSYNPRERIMKKVLLTTTALVMTAGVAAAEVSFSGTAQVSMSDTQGAGSQVNTHTDLNIAISGAADNGMTFSTSIGYDAGRQVDVGDMELDALEGGMSAAEPSVGIAYNGFSITVDGAGVDDLYNDDVTSGDVAVSGSMGGLDIGLTTALTSGDSNSSLSLGYAMGDLSVSYASTNNSDALAGADASLMSVSYKMGDTTLTASSDDDGVTADPVTKVGFSTKMNALTIGLSVASNGAAGSDIGDDWNASIAYSAGVMSASVATDEDSVTEIQASYDLGGGANVFFANRAGTDGAGANKDFSAVGINFAF
jgi:hypothetical protein